MKDIKKTSPQDVFMHLLAIILLYAIVINLGILFFQYINIYFPDNLSIITGNQARKALRFPISILTIFFPFYIWLSAYLQRDLERNPEKRELKTRKWLLYFTLFVTAIIILIDIVSITYTFLSGEITLKFILKVFSVFVISASVFAYYIWNLKKDIPVSSNPKMNFFTKTVIILVIISILAGFFIIGSPASERLRRFDQTRINHLTIIQNEIIEYFKAKQTLPRNLDDLKDELKQFSPPLDPETGENYEYKTIGDTLFELCAVFSTTNKNETAKEKISHLLYKKAWTHSKGYKCFSRKIDPDKYPPLYRN